MSVQGPKAQAAPGAGEAADVAAHRPDSAAELSCRTSKVLLLYFARVYPVVDLDALLASIGELDRQYLLDVTNFISFEYVLRLLDALTTGSGDPEFPRKAGLSVSSPEALGFMYYGVRAFGTPGLGYRKTVEMMPLINRVGEASLEALEHGRAILRYRSARPERNRRCCEVRQGQFASIPTIWTLPTATVRELECQVEGAEACRYELRWVEPPRWWPTLAGGALGIAAGWLLNQLLPAHASALVPPAFAAIGALAAVVYALVAARKDLLDSQSEGTLSSLEDLERRHREILELNASLERKVDERTRQLQEQSAELSLALEKQIELDRLKTQFFQNVSHELRTPLTLILAPLDLLLKDDEIDARVRRQLTLVRRSALRLLGLINGLLELSSLDARKQRLSLEDADAAAIVRHVVESAQSVAHQRGIELTYEGPEALPGVPLDIEKVEKMLLNLISNALKFTVPELLQGRAACVSVSAAIEEGTLAIRVRDSGVGIPRGELGLIFERFHQADGSARRMFGGTGIGLSLVKELAEFHGGSIDVESQEREGSTFTLRLPVSREVYPQEQLCEEGVDPSGAGEPGRRQGVGRLRRQEVEMALAENSPQEDVPRVVAGSARRLVLVADDNRDMLAYMVSVLSAEYRVLTATDGRQALELALEHRPSLVVSDVMMPRMDGHALVRELRRSEGTRAIPVILVTAKADVDDRVNGLDIGADDYLPKPFNFEELRARIRALLRRRGDGEPASVASG